jgi:trk system potassium uptake protein TrkH
MLLLTEEGFSFLDIFFESLSAFATTGLTRGITADVSWIGKIILMASMIIGRIGSLTLVLAMRRAKEKQLYRYPEERVLIG